MKAFVLCLLAVSACRATHLYGLAPLGAPVSYQYHTQDELGQYSFGYAGGPSAKQEMKTFDGVTRGGYSYVDANGLVQHASYVADPINGFRVAATNIPVGPAPVAPIAPIAPVVTLAGPLPVADTPEVVAAKISHFAAHAEARSRARRSAPLKPDGTVDDTFEVKLAKAAHFAAKATPYWAPYGVLGRSVVATPYWGNYWGGYPWAAPLNIDGTVAETPEVVAAKISHFAAHAEALSRSRRSAPLKPDGTVDDTVEVKLAKAAHFAAKAAPYWAPYGVLGRSAVATPYWGNYWGGYPWAAPLNIDGTVADTPEVAAAKAAHYAAHVQARLG